MKTYLSVFLAVVATVSPFTLRAGVLINIQEVKPGDPSQQGGAVLGDSGDSWNAVAMNPIQDFHLADAKGASTPITLTSAFTNPSKNSVVKSETGLVQQPDSTKNANFTYTDAGTRALMQDMAYAYNYENHKFITATMTFKLSGLSSHSGENFQLVVYSAVGDINYGSTLSLSGDVTGGNTDTVLKTSAVSRRITAGPGVAYETFNGKITGDSLTLTVTNPGDYAVLSGMQLQIGEE